MCLAEIVEVVEKYEGIYLENDMLHLKHYGFDNAEKDRYFQCANELKGLGYTLTFGQWFRINELNAKGEFTC